MAQVSMLDTSQNPKAIASDTLEPISSLCGSKNGTHSIEIQIRWNTWSKLNQTNIYIKNELNVTDYGGKKQYHKAKAM